jgi:hypothetical protein
MGREVKRVALDFNWPLRKVWEGFLNERPGPEDCKACGGSGLSPTAKKLKGQWYGNAPFTPEENGSVPLTVDHPAVRQFATKNAVQSEFISIHGFDKGIDLYWKLAIEGDVEAFINSCSWIKNNIFYEAQRLIGMWNGQWSHHLNADDVKALVDAGRLMDFTCRPRNEEQVELLKKQKEEGGSDYWLKDGNGYVPTPQEVNDWNIFSMGHDAINQWVCVKARCKKLRVSTSCKECKGKGSIWQSKEAMRYHNAWRSKEPPKGDGWQIWETVSEGSPVSPVFATPEEIARWMVIPGNDTSTTKGTTYEQWMGFLGVGWCMSGYSDSNGYQNGVKAVGDRAIAEAAKA